MFFGDPTHDGVEFVTPVLVKHRRAGFCAVHDVQQNAMVR